MQFVWQISIFLFSVICIFIINKKISSKKIPVYRDTNAEIKSKYTKEDILPKHAASLDQ
jgi:hypothetical protein